MTAPVHYVHYLLATGEIVGAGVALDIDAVVPVAGGAVLAGLGHPDSHCVRAGEVVLYSPEGAARKRMRPSGMHRWDPVAEDWIDERSLGEIGAELIERLKVKRDSLIEGGFVWDGSAFDSDAAISQPRLLGLYTSAISGAYPPEGYPWRLADNTWRVLSATDAAGVWVAFQTHMAGMFAAFAAHESAVLAEPDIEALRNYDIDSNWP